LNLVEKQKLTRKSKPFTLKEGIVYRMGQGNKMRRCLTTSKAQNILKELHEGVARGQFVIDIIAKKNLDVGYW
jgi:site-specific recombinase XerC